jgi:signal transduction histidine kinase/ligand-binding sensor domain-containing protein/CheY-like chemotaxis protein/AraC-like DNA-binding protein
MKSSRLIFLICFFSFSDCVIGQINNLEFGHILPQNGLSNSDINAIVQDADGFMWFGTEYGLNRYDGYQIKIYRNITSDSLSLSDNSINALFIDHDGILWLGTARGGLCKYNKYSDNFESYMHEATNNNCISFNYITSIAEDNKNNLWIATLEGLNKLNPQRNTIVQYNEETKSERISRKTEKHVLGSKFLKNKSIRFLMFDNENNLWFGYERAGLGMYNSKEQLFYHYPLPNYAALPEGIDNSIHSIIPLGDEIWLGTRFTGILIFNKKTKSFTSKQIRAIDNRVTYLMKDQNKLIWIATKKGLFSYNEKTLQTTAYYHQECNPQSLSNNSILCLFKDRQNVLWAGSLQGGVNFSLPQNGFISYKTLNNNQLKLSQQSVSSVLKDKKGRLWVGYFDNGIEIIDRNNNSSKFFYDLPTQYGNLSTGSVFCIFEDKSGKIWIGTYFNGLFCYNESTKQFINYKYDPKNINSLSGNDIRSISEDKNNNLWLAIHGRGINKLNPRTGEVLRISYPTNGFGFSSAHDWVYQVHVDTNNILWVSSVSGISCSEDNSRSFKNYLNNIKNKNNESINVIWTLYDDGENLWMGSNMGLSIFNKKQRAFTKVLTKNEGLPTDAIASIQADNKKHLWISTFNGLMNIDPKNTDNIKVFNQSDGLQGDHFYINAGYCASNGEMFFGGINGLTSFYPDSIKFNNLAPNVLITEFKLFNKNVEISTKGILRNNISYTKHIKLKYHENVLTFNFVALNFIEPDKNKYAYMLEGFDNTWNYSVNRREITYTNLSPGDYVLRVKASNNDNVWNETGTSLKITVAPPFWETIWAFLFYILLAMAGLFFFKKQIQKRELLKRKLALEHMEAEKQIEVNNLLLRFFTNISHEFRTSLSLIIGPTEKMLEKNSTLPENLKYNAKTIQHNGQRLLRLINQLLDLRKIEAGNMKLYLTLGDIVSFCNEISKSFEYTTSQKNIHFKFECKHKEIFALFDADKIEKIIYNLLSNAYKYTLDQGSISLKIALNDNPTQTGNFIIEVRDNGIGIPNEDLTRIFDRFYQVENNEHPHQGTGIGLSLVKELVDMHKGSIEVKSTAQLKNDRDKPSGSIFTIKLPIEIKEKNDADIPEITNISDSKNSPIDDSIKEKSDKSKNHTLLIVEDNAELRSYITSILNDTYTITEAENGLIGIKTALDNNFDLIISDIMMPGMQGTELCKVLKSDSRTSHIPVILLTALSAVEHKISGFNYGADDYITKPFNSDFLKTRIANLIESRQKLRERFSKYMNIEPKEIAITSLDEKFLQKAIETVEKYIDDPVFDIDKFTWEMSVSRTLLHNKLKSLTNLSATQFIKTIRLKRAAQLIKKGHLGVSEVSIMVGFSSRTYFTKCFIELFGVSPSEY